MNQVVLIGRLTKDVELKQGRTPYCKVSLAIDRQTEGTDFPRVTIFGKQAENLAKYQGKGSLIAIEGHVTTGNYKKDGETIFTSDIVADRVEWLSKKEGE